MFKILLAAVKSMYIHKQKAKIKKDFTTPPCGLSKFMETKVTSMKL